MTNRATLKNVSQFIAARQDFDCNGTLTGKGGSGYITAARLPDEFSGELAEATKAEDFYVVKSYATPIAWFANGAWTFPDTKYSPTTSRHQSKVRVALRIA